MPGTSGTRLEKDVLYLHTYSLALEPKTQRFDRHHPVLARQHTHSTRFYTRRRVFIGSP